MRNIEVRLKNGTVLQKCRIGKQKKVFRIGRAANNDIVIDDSHIDAVQMEISVHDDELLVKNLGKGLGTTINLKLLPANEATELKMGDDVVIAGKYYLRIVDDLFETTTMQAIPSGIGEIVQENVGFFESMFGSLKARLKLLVGDNQLEFDKTMNYFSKTINQKIRELAAIHEMSIRMNQIHDFKILLDTTVGMALEVSGAQRGAIMLFNEERQDFDLLSQKGIDPKSSEFSLSKILCEQAFRKNEVIIISNAATEPAESGDPSVIKSVAAAPLQIRGEVMGVLYLDNQQVEDCFSDQNLGFIKAFSAHASVAIYNARMFFQAVTDGMTKLYNNKYFRQRLSEELRRASRHKKPLSLIIFDIDHFKKFNDTYGHQVGDKVIRAVGNAVRETVRICDVAARYGGEEFALILPETDKDGALLLAERLREKIETMALLHEKRSLHVTSSFGVVSLIARNQGREEMIRLADDALYQSKRNGRNRVTMAPDED